MIPKGTTVTIRTANGGLITLPLAANYRPTFDAFLNDGTPAGVHIWAGRIASVEEAGSDDGRATTVSIANATESGIHEWSADASELGLPPGQWPRSLRTQLGNGLSFTLVRLADDRATYRQTAGCLVLTVWND
jgi:hypothetical protein